MSKTSYLTYKLQTLAPPLNSSGRPSIMGDGDDLFVVVSWENYSQWFTSILQLETQGINHEYDPCTQEAPVVQSEFSVSFRLPEPHPTRRTPIQWGYALLADSPTKADLHIVPDWCSGAREDAALHSCIFNLKTKECKRIVPPHARKDGGHVVAHRGHTYFIALPNTCSLTAPDPVFERYNHLNDEWEILQPLPQAPGAYGGILATAVWDDTILLNVYGGIRAYNVDRNKWYRVKMATHRCCEIVGEAIVIGNTIYALSQQRFNSVAALSIRKEVSRNGDDIVYKCSLSEIILVPGEESIEFEYGEESRMCRHLVHLGGDNFCLVHSCKSEHEEGYQHIQLTHLKLNKGEKSMTVTNRCVHQFKLEPQMQFEVRHCFSLPKCKTSDLKQGETLFEFDPFHESFLSRRASKYEEKTDINVEREVVKPVQEEENVTLLGPLFFDVEGATSELDAKSNVVSKASTISAVIGDSSHAYEKASLAPKTSTLADGAASSELSNADEEDHSICVVKFSRNATVRELVDEMTRFGPIQSVGIHVTKNTMEKPCANVEFESAASKRLAIEASPITIGGLRAVIQNPRQNGVVKQ